MSKISRTFALEIFIALFLLFTKKNNYYEIII